MPWFVGIDPGASGAIAAIAENGEVVTFKMPADESDLARLIEELNVSLEIESCLLEEQHARPAHMADPENPGKTIMVQGVTSTWTFACGYGIIRGVLASFRIPRETIRPRDWQKALGIAPRHKKPPESQSEWKGRLRKKAQELFPRESITLQLADAILIAETCRRMKTGRLF